MLELTRSSAVVELVRKTLQLGLVFVVNEGFVGRFGEVTVFTVADELHGEFPYLAVAGVDDVVFPLEQFDRVTDGVDKDAEASEGSDCRYPAFEFRCGRNCGKDGADNVGGTRDVVHVQGLFFLFDDDGGLFRCGRRFGGVLAVGDALAVFVQDEAGTVFADFRVIRRDGDVVPASGKGG